MQGFTAIPDEKPGLISRAFLWMNTCRTPSATRPCYKPGIEWLGDILYLNPGSAATDRPSRPTNLKVFLSVRHDHLTSKAM
jgi:hypothetical protein